MAIDEEAVVADAMELLPDHDQEASEDQDQAVHGRNSSLDRAFTC
jgi:hypothetical protein